MVALNSVSLIAPKSEILHNPGTQWKPPLGLLSVATFLKHSNQSISIKVADGELEILNDRLFGADLIGFSASITNYTNVLKLAEDAHNNGARVIIGGAYASSFAERIAASRDFIDAVVVGDGEYAVDSIAKGHDLSKVPNLVFVRQGKIVKTITKPTDFNSVPFPDRSLVNLEAYIKNFVKYYPKSPFKRPTTFFSQRGCFWRGVKGGCIFCSRAESCQFKHPELVWQEVLSLEEQYDIDYLDDLADNYTQNPAFLKKLLERKPKTNVRFRVWARSDQITESMAKLLARLGVHDVFLGIESGDAACLENLNKGTTPRDNLRAAQILKKYGLKAFISFVIGAPGESAKSLESTIAHAKQLVGLGNVETILADILMPLPGSRAFEMLSEKVPVESDVLNPLQLQKEWIEHFTSISWDEAIAAQKQIFDLEVPAKLKRRFLGAPQ